MKKTITKLLTLSLSTIILLTACGKAPSDTSKVPDKTPTISKVRVGVVGENNEVWEFVKEKLAKEQIEVELVRFTDYHQPNDALVNGDLELNSFQHRIFLDNYNKDKGTDLTPIGDTVIAPLGIYSQKIDHIDKIAEGDHIAIPNDVTNAGRALLLLQTAGLIQVDASKGQTPTVADITENKLNLVIQELDASQTARSLPDVAASIINSGVAVDADFVPTENAIFLEPITASSQPYVNIIVARAQDKDNELYQKIVAAYQSEDTKKVIAETSKGSSVPAWK